MTELTCIVCPKGCRLNVDEENGFLVTGHECPRGKEYGHRGLTAPTRTLTSIVRIEGAIHPCCPVKTSGEISKKLITQTMNLLKEVRLTAPVDAGAVVVQDICGTGVDWITTKNMQVVKTLNSSEALEPDGPEASIMLTAVHPPEAGWIKDGVPDYTLDRNSTMSPSSPTEYIPQGP